MPLSDIPKLKDKGKCHSFHRWVTHFYLTAALVWMSSRQLPEVSTAIPLASVSR